METRQTLHYFFKAILRQPPSRVLKTKRSSQLDSRSCNTVTVVELSSKALKLLDTRDRRHAVMRGNTALALNDIKRGTVKLWRGDVSQSAENARLGISEKISVYGESAAIYACVGLPLIHSSSVASIFSNRPPLNFDPDITKAPRSATLDAT